MGVPEVDVSEEGVCYRLPVKFQDMKFKFNSLNADFLTTVGNNR